MGKMSLKIIGLILGGVSLGAGFLGSIVEQKQTESMIDEKIKEALNQSEESDEAEEE